MQRTEPKGFFYNNSNTFISYHFQVFYIVAIVNLWLYHFHTLQLYPSLFNFVILPLYFENEAAICPSP
jgi:hypothetical protein